MENPFERLPHHWQQWVEKYAKESSDGKWNRLGTNDFNGFVKIRFPDGSLVLFEYAFYAINEEKKELAVFTEHCGYHVFPLFDDLEYSYNVWAESPGNSYKESRL
ncbi:MAG: hypothetical protein GY795_34670 [Desulfobacterales bacterium]|nr:hypothetical protein [Desulfobacterales bacterium]